MDTNLNKLSGRIKSALKRFEKAKINLDRVKAEVQYTCNHPIIVEMEFGTAYRGSSPHRICKLCGLEEEGTTWSGGNIWAKHDFNKSALCNKKGRVVTKAHSSDEFYAYRLPR